MKGLGQFWVKCPLSALRGRLIIESMLGWQRNRSVHCGRSKEGEQTIYERVLFIDGGAETAL